MSLNLHIRSTKLLETTDFYDLFNSAEAENDKTYFIYEDGTKEEATIYDLNVAMSPKNFEQDKVVGLIVGDAVTSLQKSFFQQFPNLKQLKLGKAFDLTTDGLFASCSNLTSIYATAYLSEDIVEAEEDLKSSGFSLFVDSTSTTSKTIAIKCNDGWLDVECEGSSTSEYDSTIEVVDTSKCAHALHNNGGSFSLKDQLQDEDVGISACDVKKITISEKLTIEEISAYSFSNSKIESIDIPEGVQRIGSNAFESNTSLSNVQFPSETLSSIGDNAFLGCTSLKSVTIPESTTNLGKYAFANTGVISAYLPSSVGVKQLSYKDSWNYWHSSLFRGCSNLRYLEMPGVSYYQLSVEDTRQGSYNFHILWHGGYGCIYSMFDGRNVDTCVKLSNDVYALVKTTSETGPNYCQKYEIEKDIETKFIRKDASKGTNDWKGIIFGQLSVENVMNRSNLGEAVIGYGVESIGDYCFNGTSLERISFVGNTCKSLGEESFSNLTSLTCIEGDAQIQSVGSNCFDGCFQLEGIENIISGATSFGAKCFNECLNIDIDKLIETGFLSSMSIYQISSLLSVDQIFGDLENNQIMLKSQNDDIRFKGCDGEVVLTYVPETELCYVTIDGKLYQVEVKRGSCNLKCINDENN